MNETVKSQIKRILDKAKFAFVSSIDTQGFPNTKAMFALKHDSIAIHYFSTNYSAKRTKQFLSNPRACVYLCNQHRFMGLMLVGTMEVLTDHDSKVMLWKPRDIMYYSQGVNDPDYCVLKFTAQKGNYYHGLKNYDFDMNDI
jgi:general stress protein 26